MDYRRMGHADLQVSAIGFGCGAVGGLIVQGDPGERARAVARAIDLGITYFDTASAYGGGLSETNLGAALRETRADVIVGSKIRLRPDDLDDIEGAVVRLVDEGLRRLGRDCVDLMQLHNLVGQRRGQEPEWLGVDDVGRVIHAFARLRDQGKLRFWGINGPGDVDAVHDCLRYDIHSIQVCFNLLNPTACITAPPGFPFTDQRNLIGKGAAKGIGILAYRILAGGALSGVTGRHANATATVDTIFSSGAYDQDVRLSHRLKALIDAGFADGLVEAAIRFAVWAPGVSSAVIGFSTIEQIEEATRHAAKGPLPGGAMDLLHKEWAGFGTD